MLEKLDTTHNNNIGSDIDLINTGSTSKTLIGEVEHHHKDEMNLKDTEYNYNNTILDINQDESPTDKELVSQIQDRELEEKKILKTLDRRMMPLFCIFYFVDFLDRANIGNAT